MDELFCRSLSSLSWCGIPTQQIGGDGIKIDVELNRSRSNHRAIKVHIQRTLLERCLQISLCFLFFFCSLVLIQFVVPSNKTIELCWLPPSKKEQRKMPSNITITGCFSFSNHKMKSKSVLFNIGCLFRTFSWFILVHTHTLTYNPVPLTCNIIDQGPMATITSCNQCNRCNTKRVTQDIKNRLIQFGHIKKPP